MANYSGVIRIDLSWTNLKSVASLKNLAIQYDSSASEYDIFCLDGNIAYISLIFRGSVPDTTRYNQVQNDLDKTDFETSYKDIVTNRSNTAPAAIDGYAITTTNPILIAGSDGSFIRTLKSDSSGRLITVGLGAAGTPLGGIFSIQGVSGGQTVPVSGTITATGTIAATQSGTWTVQPGNTANTTPWLTTINQGGNSATVTGANALKIDGSAVIQPVSGTVTANIGTTNGLALDATLAKLTIVQGTALGANTQAMVGGSVTTAAPTYTTGQISPLSLSTAGALRVDGSGVTQPVSGTVTANQGVAPWSQNVTQFGGVNISTGTGASGTGIPRVTVSNDSNILATQSGTWTVQPGNTANTTPWLTTINQGGNSATVTASNALKVDGSAVIQPVSGTVTANIGTTNGLALDATLTGGAQTTRITDGTNTATVKAASTAAAATDKALVVAVSPNNIIPISTVGVPDVTSSGALGALNAAVTLALTGESSAGFQLSAGTLIGTIIPEVSTDGGTTWVSAYFLNTGNNIQGSSAIFPISNPAVTASIIGMAGASHVRVRVSAFTSGTANLALRASAFQRNISLTEALSGGTAPVNVFQMGGSDGTNLRAFSTDSSGRLNVNQGTAAVLASKWPVQITDGTNTMPTGDVVGRAIFNKITDGANTATVKAASVAAVITDPALVVAISPNNTAKVAEYKTLINYSFNQTDTTVDAQFWTTSVTGTGSVTQSSGIGTLANGATANSTASIQSIIVGRLMSGNYNSYSTDVQVADTGIANNVRSWGVYDANNGYLFKLNGTTFQTVVRKATVDTATTVSGFTLDTNFHKYEIIFNGMSVFFLIDGNTIATVSNISSSAPTANDNLPVRFETVNSGGLAVTHNLVTRSVGLSTFGANVSRTRFITLNAAATTVIKRGPGTLRRVIINTTGGLGASLSIFDNTAGSGTSMGVSNTGTIGNFEFDLEFNIGLTVVIAGTPNITFVYE